MEGHKLSVFTTGGLYMNLEDVRCGGGDDEFLIHPSTPLSIYILNPYKFIGDDELRSAEVIEWIKEEQSKHRLCACGCGKEIKIKIVHRWHGIPKYLNGHQNIGRHLGEKHHYWGKHRSESTKQKIRASLKGKYSQGKHYSCGIPRSEEVKQKISKANEGKHPSEEVKQKISKANEGNHHSEEAKRKISEALQGEKSPNWRGGISFEPYCYKFNKALKEEIRDKFGRKCFLCPKTEKEEGRKLSVHHVDYNKEQGCNGIRWLLIPLCRSCNTKVNHSRDYWQDLIMDKLKTEGYLDD